MERNQYSLGEFRRELEKIGERLQQLRLGMRVDLRTAHEETSTRLTAIEETLDIIARELARWASDRNDR